GARERRATPAAAGRAAAARTGPSLGTAFPSVRNDRHDAALGEQRRGAAASGLDPSLVEGEDRAVGAEAAGLRDLRQHVRELREAAGQLEKDGGAVRVLPPLAAQARVGVPAHRAVVGEVHELAAEAVGEEPRDEQRGVAHRPKEPRAFGPRRFERPGVEQRERRLVVAGLGRRKRLPADARDEKVDEIELGEGGGTDLLVLHGPFELLTEELDRSLFAYELLSHDGLALEPGGASHPPAPDPLECTKRASTRRPRLLPANNRRLRALAACLGRKSRPYEPPWVSPPDTFQFRPRSAACSTMMQRSITTIAPAVAARRAASSSTHPSWNHRAGARAASASSTTPASSSRRRNTSTTSNRPGTSCTRR